MHEAAHNSFRPRESGRPRCQNGHSMLFVFDRSSRCSPSCHRRKAHACACPCSTPDSAASRGTCGGDSTDLKGPLPPETVPRSDSDRDSDPSVVEKGLEAFRRNSERLKGTEGFVSRSVLRSRVDPYKLTTVTTFATVEAYNEFMRASTSG